MSLINGDHKYLNTNKLLFKPSCYTALIRLKRLVEPAEGNEAETRVALKLLQHQTLSG